MSTTTIDRGLNKLEHGAWQWSELGDVCRTTSGGTPSRKKPSYFEGPIPWVKSGELPDGLVHSVAESISEEALRDSSAKLLPVGTLLIALYGATVGKLGVLTRAAATNQAVCAIFPSPRVDTRFLFWFLRSSRSALIAQAVGGAQPNISQGVIRSLRIPIPPLGDQRGIVAEIEKQFSRLDKAIANLQRVKINLRRHASSVRKSALQDASETGLPAGWAWVTIGELAAVGTGATPSRGNAAYYKGGDIPWVTSSAVNASFVGSAEQFVTPLALAQTNLRLYPPGTLLVAMYGEGKTRGKCTELRISAATNQALAAIQVDAELRDWLKLFLDHNYENTRKIASGGVQPNLNLSHIRAIRLPVPPKAVRDRIVAEVDRRLSIVRGVEAELDASLKRAQALRQAVLSKAFTSGHGL